ncbi:ATP-dependent helicase [Gulosibacter macacae]|uniref:DNA 3'-5' helicase n=1 Tax=Gulosibacter macacae TaxID=2488791 RepID=A0A3P3W7G5_9MICO|nr:ATP-dependent DNA helicase [Gulosibacter macacae]RRJ88603.1 ATP-dependent helicase [Gulosibacter macacae]
MTRVTHEDIARAIAKPDKEIQLPTEEQRRIIESPLEPALVVAGAGSGKTQTMMVRILWLIANGLAKPHEILGLTFTRKAAGELRERIELGIGQLRAAGLVQLDEFDMPEVSTYNSFANAIYSQYALLVGREPDATLLDDPGAHGLMRTVVLESDDEGLRDGTSTSVGSVAKSALSFAHAMRENGLVGRDIVDFIAEFDSHIDSLGGTTTQELQKLIDTVRRTRTYANLADEFQRRKRERGFVEFSDQVATAAEIVEQDPAVIAEIRARARVVILDEYQDTSVAQTALLAALFRRTAVMAVGDPKQSIYGWRGASAANMSRFARDFGAQGAPYELSVSWRNDIDILAAANRVAAELPESRGATALRARPGAGRGEVASGFYLSDEDEATAIAEWLHERFVAAGDGAEQTGAVLVRNRSHMAKIAEALREREVPHRVLGLGGLLSTPEIADLNAVLRAAADEHAGSEIIRLLAGAHYEVGVADIVGLHGLARWLGQRDAELGPMSPELQRSIRNQPQGSDEIQSLAEALEYIRTSDADRLERTQISGEGLARMADLAATLHDLRARLSLPLVDLAEAAIRRTRLDLETVANPRNPVRRSNLDAYLDAIRGYVTSNPGADLNEFLEWLDLAETDDKLEQVDEVTATQGVVQLTTMHSSKGLEWDYVVVPLLNTDVMPNVRTSKGWFASATLPYELRRDAADLPQLDWRSITTTKELVSELIKPSKPPKEDEATESKFYEREHLRLVQETRRLAYVAVTRAKRGVMLTSSRWHRQLTKPRWPSEFHRDMVGELTIEVPPGCEPYTHFDDEPINSNKFDDEGLRKEIDGALNVNPNDRNLRMSWPRPTMSKSALSRNLEIADQVTSLVDESEEPNQTRFDALIDLLIAERAAQRESRVLAVPERFGASYFHDLLDDPVKIARNAARPMPQEPFAATLIGNLFHNWVESLFTDLSAGAAYLDGLELEDADLVDQGLARATADDRAHLDTLKATFLKSRFAPEKKTPIAVELPIDVPLGDATVVGKLDAVYRDNDTDEVEIVDWKTGKPPRTQEARAGRELQLMLYAHAYAESYQVPLDRIRATLYYVGADEEISITEITPKQELLALLDAARETARRA